MDGETKFKKGCQNERRRDTTIFHLRSIFVSRTALLAEELENWLRRSLSKNAEFEYRTVNLDNITIGVMIIQCATERPVSFRKVE